MRSNRDFLEEGLETELSTERGGQGRVVSRLAWGIGAALLLVVAFLYVRAAVQWRQGVRALQATPGIVVVNADRGFRGYSVAGLRDPDAQPPSSVLATHGVDTTRVSAAWEQYLSLEPGMVQTRLERWLGKAPNITWDIQRDTVRAIGSAPLEWLVRAESPSPVAGVNVLDVARVTIQVPDSLINLRDELRRWRIDFDTGSAVIPLRARASIDSVTTLAIAAVDEATSRGLTVEFDLIGRTDATGSSESNRMLSQQRAEAVLAALRQRGVTDVRLVATGIGTDEPLTTLDEDSAQANRSVTVTMDFSTAGPAEGPPE